MMKLAQVQDHCYICPGRVISLTDYFDVPKGESDVRMVYNGTSCGLNFVLCAPSLVTHSLACCASIVFLYISVERV
jgi:hypothetical protein